MQNAKCKMQKCTPQVSLSPCLLVSLSSVTPSPRHPITPSSHHASVVSIVVRVLVEKIEMCDLFFDGLDELRLPLCLITTLVWAFIDDTGTIF